MPRITSITPSARREGRIEIALDDGTTLLVSLEALERFRLSVGRAITAAELARLQEESAVVQATDRALNLLAFRERSATELRRRLVQKGVESPHAEAAVARLVAQGLVDDRRYAAALARSKAGGGSSRRRVEQELSRRGVARELASAAVEEVWEEEEIDQGGAAVQLARKRAASLAGLDAATRRRRLYGFLARRGYEPDEIRAALAVVLRDGGADTEGDAEGAAEGGEAGENDDGASGLA